LIISFAITAAFSSSYRNERMKLGERRYEQGQALSSHGDMEGAVDSYREALLFSPDNTQYRLSLANALLSVGKLDEAQAHLEQLLQADPTNGRINLSLAQVALKRHKVNQAIDYFQRAVYEYWPPNEIPERRKARWQLVNLLEANHRRPEVVGELIQLYASAPPDPEERSKIGFLLIRYGAISEAEQVFRNLERTYPQLAYVHRGLGSLDFASGQYVAARHEFQHALRLDPKDTQTADLLAETNQAIELDPVQAGISGAERKRRSMNLLNRVITTLAECWPQKAPSPTAQHQLDEARNLLARRHSTDEDFSLTLQKAAGQLWQNRASFCPMTKTPADQTVDLAVRRIGYE
jgi:tetratricopeptide (TPR) repeat protein